MSDTKAVLISVHPKWVYLMDCGKKLYEVRKRPPILEPPFTVYVYQTVRDSGTPNDRDGKVVAEFTCDKVITDTYRLGYNAEGHLNLALLETCLTLDDLFKYGGYKPLYGWHITEWIWYNNPVDLSKFNYYNSGKTITCPPQGYVYVQERDKNE